MTRLNISALKLILLLEIIYLRTLSPENLYTILQVC